MSNNQQENKNIEQSEQQDSDLIDEQEYQEEQDSRPPPLYIGDEKKMKAQQLKDEEYANFEPDEDYEGMEKIQIPVHEKKLGGEAFKKKQFELACKHYSKALIAFDFLVRQELIQDQEQMIQYIEDIQVPCNLNLSLCYFKLKEFPMGQKYADSALELDENNVKALYRRAMCKIYQSDFQGGRSDLKKAYTLDPTNKDIMGGFEVLIAQQKKEKEKMKKMSQKIIGGMTYSKECQQEKRYEQQDFGDSVFLFGQGLPGYIQTAKNLMSFQGAKQGLGEIIGGVKYNAKILALLPLNIITQTCCKRKIPSQFFKKNN